MLALGTSEVRLRAGNWQLLAAYGVAGFIGLRVGQSGFWLLILYFVLTSGFIAWLANLKRFRSVDDTPTSKIASAPQGYVELSGHGRQPPGDKLLSYLTGLPCLWYRYSIEQKNGDKWVQVAAGESHDTFGLDDGSGLVLIDPDGAEILTSRRQVWTEGDYRKSEWSLIEGEPLYVLGEHATLGGAQSDLNKSSDISALLAEWKQDKGALLRRFDRNGDGEIDLAEWALVRQAAELEVEREHAQVRLQDGVHVMRGPRNGRPYLIANSLPDALVRRYRIWSWVYLGFALASLGLIPWMTG